MYASNDEWSDLPISDCYGSSSSSSCGSSSGGGRRLDWISDWGLENNTFINWFVDHDDYTNSSSGRSSSSNGLRQNDASPTGPLVPASDVTVHGVLTALVLNAGVFVVAIVAYEILRRVMPAVYMGNRLNEVRRSMSIDTILDSPFPFWIVGIIRIPWIKIRENAGLDAYMFLRYIRMCLRITTVTGFWGVAILGPLFATGNGGAIGWYHLSMANVEQSNWRIWIAAIYTWLMAFYTLWVIIEENRHYLDLRMDFLGRGEFSKRTVNPQHHYSIMVECIPMELRSDLALYEYFDGLFPGKVHSASVVLNLPELEALRAKRFRTTRRLEKALAYLEATGRKQEHVVGRPRLVLTGIEIEAPRPNCCCFNDEKGVWNGLATTKPEKGDRVDSIAYYTFELADLNEQMKAAQRKSKDLASKGNEKLHASHWIDRVFEKAVSVVSARDLNSLDIGTDDASTSASKNGATQSRYGTLEDDNDVGRGNVACIDACSPYCHSSRDLMLHSSSSSLSSSGARRNIFPSNRSPGYQVGSDAGKIDDSSSKLRRLIEDDFLDDAIFFDADPSDPSKVDESRGFWRRAFGALGLDFAKVVFSSLNRNIDAYVDNVLGNYMSSTGFVTFHNLASVTFAASAPLTNAPDTLETVVAPEPRDIIWANAQVDKELSSSRALTANIFIGLGAILWSIPLAAIQAFATAASLARIPGMGWLRAMDGKFTSFVNGYLPVVALLTIILILPVLFECIGLKYEFRKTQSDLQHSIVGRYFYYQLANIYISVTAGSISGSLYDILDRPSKIFEILGKSLPTVVGYFISLLITKILAGLPMVMLRFGALIKMLFQNLCFNEQKLSQRELDEVYRDQALQYGWEYPTLLLVIVICFTYASISPIILPFGAIYFLGAMIVYKKQVLYVYTPTYESGGALFPAACDRTLIGLMCGQVTFIGYCILREATYQSLFLFPLPFITFYMMRQLRKRFAIPGTRLSLERAMDIDVSAVDPSRYFDQNAYRQPILAETATCPLPYRRNSGSRARASFDFNPSDVKAESISEESDDDVSEKIRGQKGHEAMMGLSSF